MFYQYFFLFLSEKNNIFKIYRTYFSQCPSGPSARLQRKYLGDERCWYTKSTSADERAMWMDGCAKTSAVFPRPLWPTNDAFTTASRAHRSTHCTPFCSYQSHDSVWSLASEHWLFPTKSAAKDFLPDTNTTLQFLDINRIVYSRRLFFLSYPMLTHLLTTMFTLNLSVNWIFRCRRDLNLGTFIQVYLYIVISSIQFYINLV